MNSAQARRLRTMTNALRSATEQFDFAQAREYQALREETLVLVLAGQLTDSGVDLSEFADLAATSRIVRQAVDMAARWRAIPIAGDDARVERAVDAISATSRPARSPYHEIGAASFAPVAPAIGPRVRPADDIRAAQSRPQAGEASANSLSRALSEIGAANAALFDGAGASPVPRSGAPADLFELGAVR